MVEGVLSKQTHVDINDPARNTPSCSSLVLLALLLWFFWFFSCSSGSPSKYSVNLSTEYGVNLDNPIELSYSAIDLLVEEEKEFRPPCGKPLADAFVKP